MDVVTLGESMVLFTPESAGFMRYARTFTAKVAGAESNVAIGLARLGARSAWMSKLGDDEFGKMVVSFIRGEGVETSAVHFTAEAPTGLYFKEKLSPEEFRIHYYRRGSAASLLRPEEIDEQLIRQSAYLHITGITPALSQSCFETVLHAVSVAKKHGVTVVFDPNLRKKLWNEKKARQALLLLAGKADIVLPGLEEAEFLFESKADEAYFSEKFLALGATHVILKLGARGAYFQNREERGHVPGFPLKRVVDPVGAGDGFCAGFLSGLLDGLTTSEAVRRGNAVGALVTQVEGDVEGLPDRKRLEQFLAMNDAEDVQR